MGHQTHSKAEQNFFFIKEYDIKWTGNLLLFALGEHPNHKATGSHFSFPASPAQV